ncbi:unnamed protein product [Leptosia nina]|uniref:Uncharacterized protein n=1 Tax=Leptosia nina TaxID=320188 RepID=A0AAV1JHM8_9NEOP
MATETQQEDLIENARDQIADSILYITKVLESFNDRYFGRSDLGKYVEYERIKPQLSNSNGREEYRGLKKLAMGLIPLIFHLGAASTWMVLTTILAAKSVLLGIILLVFKIAVSSAKVGSFFTHLKGSHHHEWAWSPPHEHHAPVYEISPAWSPSYKAPIEHFDHKHAIEK